MVRALKCGKQRFNNAEAQSRRDREETALLYSLRLCASALHLFFPPPRGVLDEIQDAPALTLGYGNRLSRIATRLKRKLQERERIWIAEAQQILARDNESEIEQLKNAVEAGIPAMERFGKEGIDRRKAVLDGMRLLAKR